MSIILILLIYIWRHVYALVLSHLQHLIRSRDLITQDYQDMLVYFQLQSDEDETKAQS